MDIEDLPWNQAKRLPKQGSHIYVEQISPVRAFIGEVVLIWRNDQDRDVICVRDGANDLINLAEDDRWVAYSAEPIRPGPLAIEILSRTGMCPCCDSPLLKSATGTVIHPWNWI